MAKSSATPVNTKSLAERRTEVESLMYRRPSQMSVKKKGYGADGRENLEVDETIVYSLLRFSNTVEIDGKPYAYGKISPCVVTSFSGEPFVFDGRQRRKASDEIDSRMAMIVEEIRKLGNDGRTKDGTVDLAVLTNHLITKKELAPKTWHWTSPESIPLYIGGRVGDAKQGFNVQGYLSDNGKAFIERVLWCVYRDDIDPDSIEMQEGSSVSEHARKKTPPSKLAKRIEGMLAELPKCHVAAIMGMTERSLDNNTMILQVEKTVQDAVDVGGERGGISWTQMKDEMFKNGKPISPEDQLSKLEEIRGTLKRGGKPGVPKKAPNSEPTSKSTPKPTAEPLKTEPSPKAGAAVVKLTTKLLGHFAGALEKAADSMEDCEAGSVEEADKADLMAMAAILRAVGGDKDALAEYETAQKVLLAALDEVDGELEAPKAKQEPKIAAEVDVAAQILDLAEKWTDTRKPIKVYGDGRRVFEPNWIQADGVSEAVKEKLAEIQVCYRKHETDQSTAGEEVLLPQEFIEQWVNENLLAVK